MVQRDEHYTLDEQGLLVEKVGPWGKDNLRILADYIRASGGARRKYPLHGPTYIDVFCGPGRSVIRDTNEFIDGSPVVAFKKANGSPAPFTSITISDANAELLTTAENRLSALGAPVRTVQGPASSAMPQIVQRLEPGGLHLEFLDPHNLGTLSFDLFESLAKLKRIDVIVHVSLSDLQRNADRYMSAAHDQFDTFAPRWRDPLGTAPNRHPPRAATIQ